MSRIHHIKSPQKAFVQGRQNLEGDCMNILSVTFKRLSQTVSLAMLLTAWRLAEHYPSVASYNVPERLTKLLSKPAEREKHVVH